MDDVDFMILVITGIAIVLILLGVIQGGKK